MNKKIKRLLALTLIISAYSVMEPTKYINLTATKAEANTTSIYLEKLSINKADIDFDSNKMCYSVNVDDSVDEIRITARPKSEGSEVEINNSIVDSSDKYRKIIELDHGENIIKIKVENNYNKSKTYTLNITRGKSNSDDIYLNNISLSQGKINFNKETNSYDINVKSNIDKITIKAKPEDNNDDVKIDGSTVNEYNEYKHTIDLETGKNEIIIEVEDKKKNKRSYKLNVTRQDDSNGIEVQDNIYLDYIKLSDAEINISKAKTSYDVKVKKNVDRISIHAEPESTEYMVEINGKAVEESDDYTTNINLNEFKTEIKVKIEDLNNKKRTYTLNIYRGDIPVNINEENQIDNNKITKINQWVKVNNKWQYYDSIGNPLKNTWFYDSNSGKNYYLKADGTMAINWLNNNGHWYYLDQSGARQTGWKFINGQWYYLDSQGIMKTGWILDSNGKYYYLKANGSMARNTTINGYKLGTDGAWNN